MRLNELFPVYGARKKSKRVGRGLGSGKGKTSGSGVKGQKSRTGVAINGFEGGQMPIHRRLPKRGFNNPNKVTYQLINLSTLQALHDKGLLQDQVVNSEFLFNHGLIKNKSIPVKLLAKGEINFSVSIELKAVSAAAKEAIISKGGKIY
jgi:large subunit ribosomal protein L15